jgi:hypothetical protein
MLLPSLLTLAEMTTIDRNIATRNDDCDCATHTDAQPLSLLIFDLLYHQIRQAVAVVCLFAGYKSIISD